MQRWMSKQDFKYLTDPKLLNGSVIYKYKMYSSYIKDKFTDKNGQCTRITGNFLWENGKISGCFVHQREEVKGKNDACFSC